MRVDQYALVPADGGVLASDGALPHVENDWELGTLTALLPATRYLRLAAHVEAGPEHVLRLRTFERVAAPGTLDVHVPEPLRAAFDQALAEANGAPPPPRRPPWSLPGWHDEVEAWAGVDLELVRSWPLSYVARADGIFFKAVFDRFHHEPAITAAIGAPRVLRIEQQRGWMLMEAVEGETGHHDAMRSIAAVHRDWTSRVDEALALGAHDRRAPSVLPHTLIHGDFHPGNILGGTIIDWSDAAVANPLHDVNYYLLDAPAELRSELIAAYAEAWPEYDVARAVAECEAETYEYIAQSYVAITAACADDDQWWFADEEARWLARADAARQR